tara:strand:+ start:69 stop:347 length:279 start_codon:yes stop_codon:yes gene_type:complete
MTNTSEELSEFYDELLFADGFDDAIVGVSSGMDEPRVVYDIDKMIDILIKEHSMEGQEAIEFLEFNTIFAWVGDKTPIYINTKEELLCQNIQ